MMDGMVVITRILCLILRREDREALDEDLLPKNSRDEVEEGRE